MEGFIFGILRHINNWKSKNTLESTTSCYEFYHQIKYELKLPGCQERIAEGIECIKIVFLSVGVILFFVSISL